MQKDTERELARKNLIESPFGEDDERLSLSALLDGHGWEWVATSLVAKEKLKELSALIIILVGLPIRFSLANNRDSHALPDPHGSSTFDKTHVR